MSADLARRLLDTGAVPADEVYAALLDVVVLGVPFVQALVARGAAVGENVERELARIRVPTLRAVRVAAELARHLPAGLCERMLAVPVGSSPNGEAEVACVDPLDAGIGREFSFHLGVPVRLVRAPLSQVLLAIERWLDERDAAALQSSRTPAFGTTRMRRPSTPGFAPLDPGERSREPAPAPPAEERQSAPPFPLVRRSIPSRVRVDTNPGVGSGRSLSLPDPDERDESGEPIIGLTRSKPPPAADSKPRPVIVEPDVSALDRVESPDELVRTIAELAAPLAESVWVFAMKSGINEVRAVRPALGEAALALKLAAVERCVLDVAVRDGHFLGRLPDDGVHRELRGFVGDAEVYAVPVLVAERPALGLLLAGLGSTLSATRSGDAIAERAAVALARILLNKKRG